MKKKYNVVLIILLLLAGAILAGTLFMKNTEANLARLSALEMADVDLSELENGSYHGSYKAFPVEAEVKVTVENHLIKEIEIVRHFNGQGKPAEVIPERVIEKQSLDVDVVTGATYSSKVILKAIENALTKQKQ